MREGDKEREGRRVDGERERVKGGMERRIEREKKREKGGRESSKIFHSRVKMCPSNLPTLAVITPSHQYPSRPQGSCHCPV